MFLIRDAREDDYEDLLKIFQELVKKDGYNGRFMRAPFNDFIKQRANGSKQHYIKIAVDAETREIAGVIMAYHRKDGQTTVRENFRAFRYKNHGVNELLHEEAFRVAAAHGSSVALSKLVDRSDVWKFAQKIGFTAISRQTPRLEEFPGKSARSPVIVFAKAVRPEKALEQCMDIIHTSCPKRYTEEMFVG